MGYTYSHAFNDTLTKRLMFVQEKNEKKQPQLDYAGKRDSTDCRKFLVCQTSIVVSTLESCKGHG